MLKIATTLILLVLLPAQAMAISRYASTEMACEDVRAIIRSEGAVILRYPSKRDQSLELFDRYVSDSRFCEYEERAMRTTVPAADTDSCRVFMCRVLDSNKGGRLVILPRR